MVISPNRLPPRENDKSLVDADTTAIDLQLTKQTLAIPICLFAPSR